MKQPRIALLVLTLLLAACGGHDHAADPGTGNTRTGHAGTRCAGHLELYRNTLYRHRRTIFGARLER